EAPVLQSEHRGNAGRSIRKGPMADGVGQQGEAKGGSGEHGVGGVDQAGIGGNGQGILGTGSIAGCFEQQGATKADGGPVTPVVPVVVCGNGVGAGGTGSDAVCGAEVSSSAPPSPPVMAVAPNVKAVPTAAEAAASAAGGASSTSSSGGLPRTGASTLVVLGIGAAMVAMGLVAVRLRRGLTCRFGHNT